MGTTLTGTTPQDTYDSLIKVTDNGPLSGTAKYLSDGLGNDSVLALSTSAVGIGTASPTSGRLQVKGTGSTDATNVIFTDNSSGAATFAVRDNGNAFLAGNVGIGTSSPSYKLQADITDATAYSSANTLTASPIFWVNNNSTTAGTAATIRLDGGALGGNAAATISSVHVGSGSSALTFGTRNANSDITERVRILAGGGITFNGDTAAANALDDYEEGTWTMGISFGGASVGVTTAFNTGTYTKIGRQVTVNGLFVLTSKGSSTGEAAITGLPFNITNNTAHYSAATMWMLNISFANQSQSVGIVNSTRIEMFEITEAGVQTTITNDNFANNSEVILSFTYFV